jgi:hypothetical protein
MAAYARHHLLPFGNYTLQYLADPSLEKMGSDKKNKGIGSHEKLVVTVFLGPLSDRHWLYLYMEIVARRTRRTKATDTDLYIFISDGKRVFDCSVEQTDHSVEQRLSLAYRGDLS